MTTRPQKPVIGLVGGIGAGKSLAAECFARRGGAVIDADKLGHEALEVPEVKRQLVERWGPSVLKPDGTANRRAIAGIVFPDPAERRALEGMVYPIIGRHTGEAIAKAQSERAVRFVVLDAAVMLEAGWSEVCDRVIYVDAPREIRLARLASRSGWSEREVAARESAQMSVDEKKSRADVVIVNDGSPERLQERIDRLLTGWGLLPAG